MHSSIPSKRVNKYCKVCFQKTGKKYYGEKLGNRVECPNCGREILVSGNKSSGGPFSSMDPVRFRTRGFGMGMGGVRGNEQDGLDTWKAPAPIRRPERRVSHQSVNRFPLEPDFDPPYDSEKEYRIAGVLPYIKNLEELSCEVINGMLTIESLKENFEFFKEFKLPEDVLISSLQVALKNGILEIRFKKRKRTSKK